MALSAGNLPPKHLPFNYEKVKVCHGKVNNCDYWRLNVNDKFTQFQATIWAKHNTQWQWSKILKIMTLV